MYLRLMTRLSATLAAAVFLVGFVAAAESRVPPFLERSFEFAGSGCSQLQWTVDQEAMKIIFRWVSKEGASWTAFGLSANGGMKGADIAAVKALGDGSFQAVDMYSSDFVLPETDIVQNVELLEAYYDKSGRMHVTIQRDLDTCDDQDLEVQPHKQYIVCASGALSENDEILYHGPNRATGLVNLLVDEEILFEKSYESVSNSTPVSLGDGITLRGDPFLNANTPIPLDLQMPGITLDSSISTQLRCRVFNITEPMQFTASEGVWGDGVTTTESGETNDVLHHSLLMYCEATWSISSHMEGEVWDCETEMPACEIVTIYARGSGLLELPSGLHFPLRAGTYVLTVHYENPYQKEIVNDESGVRVWVQPNDDGPTSQTEAAQIVGHDCLYESIQIPADPEQKEIALQYLVSAEATKEFLPPGGVQAFGSVLHMHKLGVGGRVELIRDGKHHMDVYNSKAHDFDRQSPDFKRWKLLPGDALIITCVYKPLVDKNVSGGFSSFDEMCIFYVGWTPSVPHYGRVMGVMVREGEDFLNTQMGDDVDANARFLNYTAYKYPPIPARRSDFEPLDVRRKNVCRTFSRENLLFNQVTFADAAIPVHLIGLLAFLVVSVLSTKKCLRWIGVETDNIRDQRNVVVYIGQLVFGTVALPLLIYELANMFREEETVDAVNINPHVMSRMLISVQALLYMFELFYRLQVRLSLLQHHLTSLVMFVYMNLVFYHNYNLLALKYGVSITLLAVMEQPLYIILLLPHMRASRVSLTAKGWSILGRVCCCIFFMSRVVVVALLVALIFGQSGRKDVAWTLKDISFGDWFFVSTAPVVGSMFQNPIVVNVIAFTFLVLILFANYSALTAMMHIAKRQQMKLKSEEDGLVDTEHDNSNSATKSDDDALPGCRDTNNGHLDSCNLDRASWFEFDADEDSIVNA